MFVLSLPFSPLVIRVSINLLYLVGLVVALRIGALKRLIPKAYFAFSIPSGPLARRSWTSTSI